MHDLEDNHKLAFSPKLNHANNGNLSARKSRSRELVSATTIVQKVLPNLSSVHQDLKPVVQ